MQRTQIYLTKNEINSLSTLTKKLNKKQSELIREAIDKFILSFQKETRLSLMQQACGIWQHRDDVTFENLRKDWDRF